MIKKLLSSKKGEGYIDVCVNVIVFVMLLVIVINIFSFIAIKSELAQVADELIMMATHTGRFGIEFYELDGKLLEDHFYYHLRVGADEYVTEDDKVQLGHEMWVEPRVETTLKGLGMFEIPITIKVKRYGLSEVYWK